MSELEQHPLLEAVQARGLVKVLEWLKKVIEAVEAKEYGVVHDLESPFGWRIELLVRGGFSTVILIYPPATLPICSRVTPPNTCTSQTAP